MSSRSKTCRASLERTITTTEERVQQKWGTGFAQAIKLAQIAYTYLRYAL